MNETQRNPYVGPRTFRTDESNLFFGREREALDLLSLVISGRLVLFYAQSGAGKSSLIYTKLIPGLLAEEEYKILPVGRVGGSASPAEATVNNIYISNLTHSLLKQGVRQVSLAQRTLTEFLAELLRDDDQEHFRHVLIIDQFEELFSTYPQAWEKRKDFFMQLAKAMEDFSRLWVVLVMREDYIAYLDPYVHLLPGKLRVRYYMQRLERNAALKAIKNPVENVRPFAEGVAEKLVDDLSSVRIQNPDGSMETQPGQFIEPVQLQVVCYNLWESLPATGNQITGDDLNRIGDVDQALEKHYANRVAEVAEKMGVSERTIREWFGKKLITSSGTRNMVLQETKKREGKLDDAVIRALQSDLVRAEKRGPSTFYELTHDRLVEPIITSNRQWFDEHLSPLQKQAMLWNGQGRTDSWLLRDQALIEVETWAHDHQDELTEIEKEFLEACRKAQAQIEERHAIQRQQLEMANKLAEEQARSASRARGYTAIAIGLVVIALIATVFALVQRQGAINASTEALNAKSNSDASAARARVAEALAVAAKNEARSSELSTIALERADSQLDLAILLGVKANSFQSTPQSQTALITLLQKAEHFDGTRNWEEDIKEIQYAPGGKIFASLDINGITVWNAETREPLNKTPINGHSSPVYSLDFSPDGRTLAAAAQNGSIVLWDVATHEQIGQPLKGHRRTINSVAFGPDGKMLASGGEDRTMILWDVATHEQIGDPLKGHRSTIFSVAFSPDGKMLASASEDRTIILWDVATHERIGAPLRGFPRPIYSIAFSPDSKMLASGSADGTIILWDVATQQPIGEPLRGHRGLIYSVAFSPNGKGLASAGRDRTIILWDVATQQPIGEPFNTTARTIYSVAFSPDGTMLASGGDDRTITLWDVATMTQLSQMKGHTKLVRDIAFNVDGKTLASASPDGTVRFWNVEIGKAPKSIGDPLLGNPIPPDSMQFSADGSVVASTAADGTLLFDVAKTESIGQPLGKGILVETTTKDGFVIYQVTDASGKDFIHIRAWSTGEERGIPIAGSSPRLIPNTKILVYRTTDQDTRLTQYHLRSLIANRELDLLPESEPHFSPNGQILAYQTTDQETGQTFVHLWNIANEKSMGEAIEGSFVGMSNQTLLSQTYNSDTGETLINLWNIREAAKIKTVASNSFLSSQEADILVFMTQDAAGSYINSLDTATGDILFPPEPGDAIHDLSPNGKVLLYESTEGGTTSLRALNARTGEKIGGSLSGSLNQYQFLGPLLIYEAYTTNPNGNNDYQFSLVNTSTAAILGDPIAGSYSSVALLQDDSSLIYQTSDDKWNFLNINGDSKSTQLGGAYLASTPDGEILAYQTFEGDSSIINLWDIEKNRKIGGPIKGKYLAMSPDATVITQSETFALNFWDVTRTLIFGEPVTEKGDKPSSAALSPDGKMLAFADSDGITIVDAASNKILKTLSGVHHGAVTSVGLSPDKNTLLTLGEDGKTIAWDLRTFQQLLNPITGTNSFFSPQGKFLVVTDESKNTAAVWDMAGQKPVGENFSGQTVIFSPDEKYMVILDSTKNTAALWKLPTGQAAEVALPAAQSAVFGPDSKTLALLNGDIVRLWDLTSQGTIGEPFAGSSVTFSTDGRTVAIQGNGINDGGSIILFDLTKQQTIDEHIPGYLNSNPDSEDTFLVADRTSNMTTFWEWDTGKQLKSIVGADLSFTNAKIDTLVVRDEKTEKTTLWNPVTLEQIGQALAGNYFLSFSPDGTLLSMANSNRNKTIVWNLKMQEPVASITGYYSPTFCTDNKTAAWFDGASTTIMFWDLEADPTLQSLGALKLGDESTENTVAIIFGPGCKTAAIQDSSQNRTILWDVTKNKAINEDGIDGSAIARFSSDGSTVAVFNDNNSGSTTFWSVADASQIGEAILGNAYFPTDNSPIMVVENYDRNTDSYTYTMWDLEILKQIGDEQDSSIEPKFTSDGSLIIYGKNGVTFWSLAEHKITGEPLRGHSAPVNNMLFSPDNKALASLASDGIALTNLDKQTSTHLQADYTGRLTGMIAFSKDSRSLTALGEDGTILVWDLASNFPAIKYEAPYKEHVNRVYRPTLDPNGQYLIYEYDGELNIWNIENPQTVEEPIKIKNCCVGAISFSPDSNFMFYSDGRTIYQLDQWKIPTKRSKIQISFGRVPFSSLNVVMDPKNLAAPKYIISSSIDAQIWDWEKKSKISDPISDFQVLGSSARAQALIYLDMDGRVIKWDLNPAAWIRTLCAKANRDLSKEEWSQYIGEENQQPVCPKV